jgi:hypothetical protein
MTITVDTQLPGNGMWKTANIMQTSLLQQGSWMTKTIIRNLKENKINTLNKYIKQ